MDLNTILSNAIAAAIQEAIKPVVDDLQSVVRNLEDRVSTVEGGLTTLEERGATKDEYTPAPAGSLMAEAESSDATFRTMKSLDAGNGQRIDALYSLLGQLIKVDDEAIEDAKERRFTPKDHFDEWVNSKARDAADSLLDDHTSEFDHDEFATSLDEDELEDTVKRILRNASISIDV